MIQNYTIPDAFQAVKNWGRNRIKIYAKQANDLKCGVKSGVQIAKSRKQALPVCLERERSTYRNYRYSKCREIYGWENQEMPTKQNNDDAARAVKVE